MAHKIFSRSEAKKMQKSAEEAKAIYYAKAALLETHELYNKDEAYIRKLRRQVKLLKMGLENRGAL